MAWRNMHNVKRCGGGEIISLILLQLETSSVYMQLSTILLSIPSNYLNIRFHNYHLTCSYNDIHC